MGPGGEAQGHQSITCLRGSGGVEFENQSLSSGWARGLGDPRTHPKFSINTMGSPLSKYRRSHAVGNGKFASYNPCNCETEPPSTPAAPGIPLSSPQTLQTPARPPARVSDTEPQRAGCTVAGGRLHAHWGSPSHHAGLSQVRNQSAKV